MYRIKQPYAQRNQIINAHPTQANKNQSNITQKQKSAQGLKTEHLRKQDKKQSQENVQKQLQRLQKVQTIDFRNAKYQGYANMSFQSHLQDTQISYNSDKFQRQQKFNKFGIAIDQNYTWIAGEWQKKSIAEGCVAVIFGDCSKMYGRLQSQFQCTYNKNNSFQAYKKVIHENKSQNIIAFQGQGYKIYKLKNIIILDINNQFVSGQKLSSITDYNSTLTKLIINDKNSRFSYSQFHLIIVEQRKYNQNNYAFQLRQLISKASFKESQYNQQNKTQKIAISSQYLKQYSDFQSFLKLNSLFASNMLFLQTPSNYKPTKSKDLLNASKSKLKSKPYDLTISLKHQPSPIKIKLISELNYKVAKIWYDRKTCNSGGVNNGQICKKAQYYSDRIGDGNAYVEEEINDEVQGYVDYQMYLVDQNDFNFHNSEQDFIGPNEHYGRPSLQVQKNCKRNLQQYFRRSLNFNNSFLNLSIIYRYQKYFKSILKKSIILIQEQHINAAKNGYSLQDYLSNCNTKQMENKQRSQVLAFNNHNNFVGGSLNNNIDCNENKACYEATLEDLKRQIQKTQQIGRSKVSKIKASNLPQDKINKNDNIFLNRENIPYGYRSGSRLKQLEKNKHQDTYRQYQLNDKTNMQNRDWENQISPAQAYLNIEKPYLMAQKYRRTDFRVNQIIQNNYPTSSQQQQKQQQYQNQSFFGYNPIHSSGNYIPPPQFYVTSRNSTKNNHNIFANSLGSTNRKVEEFNAQYGSYEGKNWSNKNKGRQYSEKNQDLANQPLQALMVYYEDIQNKLMQQSRLNKSRNAKENKYRDNSNSKTNTKTTTPRSISNVYQEIQVNKPQNPFHETKSQKYFIRQDKGNIKSKSKSKSNSKIQNKSQSRSKSKNKNKNKVNQQINKIRKSFQKPKRDYNPKQIIQFDENQVSFKKVSKISAVYSQIQKNKKQERKYAR